VWRDHVLFVEQRVSGLVDYGSMKPDHVAVDVARLLGSMVGDDSHAWHVALEAYRAERPLSELEVELAQVLDRTGTLLGAANWLKWIHREQRDFESRELVAARLAELVNRMERW
jgi:Ser/Thr protein kinase RdoA (MazF antagonist)